MARSDRHNREYIVGDYLVPGDNRPWHIVLPSPTSAGNAKSAAETALSLSLGPAFVFLLGVAGGFPKKTNMYDVVVAERVYDVDVAKIDPDGNYIPRPDQHKATSVLLSRAKTLQDMGGWEDLLHPNLPNEPVQVWIEPIAAGSKLVASSKSEEFQRILRDAPRAVAVENEGFGVMQAAHEAAIAALVIRGISDLLDNRPKDPASEIDERVGPDPHKLKAARHAAAFMFALIGRIGAAEIEEVAKDEDEWVEVRLRWDDLKELAKGKRLALQLMGDSPVRDLTGRTGSVEIDFKTRRLVSAFVYAISLERSLLEEMIETAPDRVDTTIDTSDPDVSRIFAAVRKLASWYWLDRSEGEDEIRALAKVHKSLRPLVENTIEASRRLQGPPEPVRRPEVDKKSRMTLRLNKSLEPRVVELAGANHLTLSSVVAKLAGAALEYERSSSVSLGGFMVEADMPTTTKMSVSIPTSIIEQIKKVAERYGTTRAQILRALVGYAIEMRLTNLLDALDADETSETVTPNKRDTVVLDRRRLDMLLLQGGLTISELARRAEISVATINRARSGNPVRKTKVAMILKTLGQHIGRTLNEEELVKGS